MAEMDPEQSAEARAAIARAVEQQIAEGDPPETAETLERLMSEGYDRDAAVVLIGRVMALELFAILRQNREYDRDAYVRKLQALPELPPGA